MTITNYAREQLLKFYRRMLLIREFELRAINERRAGLIPGFIHSCVGQEATAVGACAALRKTDVITSTHRGHGHLIAKGGEPKFMMAELAARNNAVGAQNTQIKVGHVQAAAFATTVAGVAGSQFGHHEFRFSALGNKMPVPAVRTGNDVGFSQRGTGTYGCGLLTHAGVDKAGNQSGSALIDGPQLKLSDQEHTTIEFEQLFSGIVSYGHILSLCLANSRSYFTQYRRLPPMQKAVTDEAEDER